jgi:hypothetical protein
MTTAKISTVSRAGRLEKNRRAIVGMLPILLAGFLACVTQTANAAPESRTNQIRVIYHEPAEAKHRPIREAMQERRILETLRVMLSAFRLPRPMTLEVKGCGGKEDAYYSDDVATLCYEYVELIQRHAPKVATPGGVLRADSIVGAILDTVLHEAGHAVIDMLDIPVMGREEDAADFFSAYILLQFAPEDAQRLIQGVGFMMASEAREAMEQRPRIHMFAGAHGLPAQRYYNLLCMAYGSNPKAFADLAPRSLPAGRADGCGDEYDMLKSAFRKLILPHVDEAMLRDAFHQVRFNWSPLSTAADSFDAPPLSDDPAMSARDGARGGSAASSEQLRARTPVHAHRPSGPQ